jgi:hypothetical protein
MRALEEQDAKFRLEHLDLPSDGRLRNVETRRGTSEVALFGNGDEILQLP